MNPEVDQCTVAEPDDVSRVESLKGFFLFVASFISEETYALRVPRKLESCQSVDL